MAPSALSKFLKSLSLCVVLGLLLGMFCGAMLVLLGQMHHHALPPDDRWRVVLLLAAGASLFGWFFVIARFGVYVPTLLMICLLSLAIAALLVLLIVLFPALQAVATVPGALLGLILGKLACLLCRPRKVHHV
ncbi:hypothetical protein [Arenimonas oryziterrae]|uniref:Uncharacterized protein n=1 Tax=Arenimonas oryziterrae DSM 21050 = YC6267 TaxID=1121015 RepID=A0A091ATU8_9GAMM|nr:hypothetical protein [Arenimonas oryziterrae]KFN42597.1 hypothetical protein N789_13230 [Arenimonas oryziterrae DSM 21050 = YC6267]